MDKKRRHKRLSFEDRKIIQLLSKEQLPVPEIASAVGAHASTVYAELRRCPDGEYSALKAQCSLR